MASICEQLVAGDRHITGVMIESNINAGKQDVPSPEQGGANALKHGVSITDACVDWETTRVMLQQLNEVSNSLDLAGHRLMIFVGREAAPYPCN